MAVRLVFLGKLADLAGSPEREVAGPLDWQRLIGGMDESLARVIEGDTCKVAVNGTVLADKRSLAAADGDEVALLPPVSGG